ncbi:MAG: lysylphosphatidylglycerol synthase transmembrane domain-containing protein [Candidatus Nealsonbacteria bacterium]|nr:lysylphosphatidylglycerol synthase transmembrane domain-containing protein [Candidatus Nealsonbacteria bacterium]
MKRVIFFFISLLVGVVLLLWVTNTVGRQEIQSSFLIFTGWHGIVILFLSFLIILIGTWKWKSILKSQGYSLSLKQLFGPYLAGFSMGYLFQIILVGGEVFRSYILKEKHLVPWQKAAASVVIDKVLDGTGFFISILAGLIYFLLKIGLPPRDLGIIFGGVLFILFILIGVFYFKSFKKESIVRPIIKLFNTKSVVNGDILEIEREAFSYFKFRNPAFWQGLGLSFLRVLITWLRCWILVLFLGKAIGFLPALSILGFYYIAMLIPIPADLGIHELIQVFGFSALGFEASIAPAFTMIQRGAQLILALAGIIIFFKLGIGLLRAFFFRKIERLFGIKEESGSEDL